MKTPLKFLFYGLAIGIAIPFAIDIILFGTPTPCHSLYTYKDGSSIQACGSKDSEAGKLTTLPVEDPLAVVYERYNNVVVYEDGSWQGQDLNGNKVSGCVTNGLCND